jgi:hypothetical protein
MNTGVLTNHITFTRGSTNNYFEVHYFGESIGEVKRTTLAGKAAWEFEGQVDFTREGVVEKFIFMQRDNEPPTPPQPTFGEYDPKGLVFPNGDVVAGFWFLEEGSKLHLAVDADGNEYETIDEPIKVS